eukprot:CAMPEP_0113490480 /NCGR_PEP_ID=MMETSP0014_2-20120614/27068_1 /TAXON_ID=2857 /ORGANISM="Nitzschia sp." /LENGTH=157 /DNA_ID=CAMNT_0000384253 /DNA_START=592 /DNA_END=1065 /DNA_ORIENTATION=+ /assembly_acc=CAM_ASM_000159
MGDQQRLTPTSSPNSGTGTGRRHRNRQLLTALSRSNPRWLDFEMPVFRTGDDRDQSSSSSSSSSLSFIPVHEGSMSDIVQRALDIVSQAETDRNSRDPSTCCSRFAPANTGMQHDSRHHHHDPSGNQEGGDMSSDHHDIDSAERQDDGPNHNDQEQS